MILPAQTCIHCLGKGYFMSVYPEKAEIRNNINYSHCLSNVPCTPLEQTDVCDKSTEISGARKLVTFSKI